MQTLWFPAKLQVKTKGHSALKHFILHSVPPTIILREWQPPAAPTVHKKASTQSYRNLLFTHLCFLTFPSSLKICCYFWSPEVCSSWSATAVISPAVFIDCWLIQELLFLPQLSPVWHITQSLCVDLTPNSKRAAEFPSLKNNLIWYVKEAKFVFRYKAGKYVEKWVSVPVSETIHPEIIASIFVC